MKIIANISCTDFSNIINLNQLLLSQIHYENLFKDYNKEMDYSRYFKYCNDDQNILSNDRTQKQSTHSA